MTRQMPEIRPIIYVLCADGQYRSSFGIPQTTTVPQPVQTKIMGYAFVDHISGTTYGKRYETAEAAVSHWETAVDQWREWNR